MELAKNVRFLIEDGKSAEDICYELKISFNELMRIVKFINKTSLYSDGRLYTKFDSFGNLYYTPKKYPDDKVNFTTNGDFRFVVAADYHIGSAHDSLEYVTLMNEYIEDNNIPLLVHCGDVIDGPTRSDKSFSKRLNNIDDQVNEFNTVFSPAKLGLNIICVLGNHDTRRQENQTTSLYKYLNSNRDDIMVYGNGYVILKVNDKEFMVCHDSGDPLILNKLDDTQILLAGHSHEYRTTTNPTNLGLGLRVVAPALCDLPTINNILPGFLDVTVKTHSYLCDMLEIKANTIINGSVMQYSKDIYDISEFSRQRTKKKK